MGKYKRRYRGSRDKYSVEQTAVRATVSGATTTAVTVVPTTTLKGMRKVKHLTVSLSSSVAPTVFQGVYWCLVFVPEGYNPQAMGIPTTENPSVDLYPANQFVMGSGVIDFDAGPQRISTPLSRNLNSGDSIVLLLRRADASEDSAPIWGVVKYAITLQ